MLLDGFGRRRLSLIAGVAGLLAAAAASIWTGVTSGELLVTSGLFSSPGFSWLAAVMYALSAATLAAGYRGLAARDRGPALGGLVILGALFSHALLVSADLLVLFVSLAGLAVVSYGLIAGAGTRRAEEVAIRYFIQGAVATALTIYGMGVVLSLGGGATQYTESAFVLSNAPVRQAMLALGLFMAVFAFKTGAVPFHSWVPDVYETTDPPLAAFIASVPKIAAVVALTLLVRYTLMGSPLFAPSGTLLAVLAVASLAVGAFGMLRQKHVGRLLGYSGVAQVGYALAAIAAGSSGVRALIVFMVTYAIAVAGAFVVLEGIRRVLPGWDGSLVGLAGLSRRAPVLAAALAITMLSLTGIPLFAGFWGKLMTFAALVGAEMTWLAVVAGVAAVVSFGGYGSVIRAAYFEPEDEAALGDDQADVGPGPKPGADGTSARGPEAIVAVLLALVVLALGVVPLFLGIDGVFKVFWL
jgi:NADH-quinone oxidoreductase subunit N